MNPQAYEDGWMEAVGDLLDEVALDNSAPSSSKSDNAFAAAGGRSKTLRARGCRYKNRRDKKNARVLDACSRAEAVLMEALGLPAPIGFESDFSNFDPPFANMLRNPSIFEKGALRSVEKPSSTLHGQGDLASVIDWKNVPESLDPAQGELEAMRAARKRWQVEAVVRAALPVIDSLAVGRLGDEQEHMVHVVDFGAGSGHVGLLVAWLRPRNCFVTLLERKATSKSPALLSYPQHLSLSC